MKNEFAELQAIVDQLDQMILDAQSLPSADRLAFFNRANDLTQKAFALIQTNKLPADYLNDIVAVQNQLLIEVEKFKTRR